VASFDAAKAVLAAPADQEATARVLCVHTRDQSFLPLWYNCRGLSVPLECFVPRLWACSGLATPRPTPCRKLCPDAPLGRRRAE
jgi:hypothetical protein